MALNFGLLDQGGPTNFFEGYSQGQEKMQANAMAQQRAAQAQQEFGMRQQEFAAGQAEKKRLSTAAIVTQKTASARDALLRAPTAADARRIVEMQYADPDLGPIRGRFGSLAQALAEVPDEPTAFQQYKEQEAMGMEAFLKQQGSNRAFTTAMGGVPQANAMAPASAPSNAMVAPAMSGELQNKLGQRERLAMLADQSPQVKATINRLDSDIARLVEEQKPEPGFTLSAGQTRFPRGYTGVATAPAAVAATAVPPSVSEYQFAKTADGGGFIGSYQDFVKAKADATRAPTPVAAPQALPASVQEYEYAKTENGGSFVGTYQDFVKAKADAARAPAPISAPQALPQSVAEYNFAKTPDGGGFVGTLTDFMQARAEATRAPTPVVAPQALPASVLEYNFAKTPEGGGFVGTYQDFVQSKAEAGRAPVPITAPPTKVTEYEFAKTPAGGSYKGTYQQFLNLGKSEGGTADRAPSMTTIVDPTNPNQMLSIDARRYAGGGVGSVGVIGVSGKEPGAAIRQNKVEAGKTQLADDLENLRASFLTLDKMRAIPSTSRNPLSNIASATAATGIGQILGRATGTEAQVEREVINSARTRLVNSIKNATGMSAQQLNSNVELQTMLKSISDPGQPVQAALRIIEDIENAYVKGAEMPKKNAPGGGAPAAAAPASNITQQRQDANAAIAKGAPAAAVRQRFKQNTGQEL